MFLRQKEICLIQFVAEKNTLADITCRETIPTQQVMLILVFIMLRVLLLVSSIDDANAQ